MRSAAARRSDTAAHGPQAVAREERFDIVSGPDAEVSRHEEREASTQRGVDFKSLRAQDVAEIALQRTRHLLRLPRVGSPSYRLWTRGWQLPLFLEARFRRQAILEGALGDIEREFREIEIALVGRRIRRIVDIGCGHAFVDLLFHRRYGCDIHLVDIETTSEKHHGYEANGAGYASLAAAANMLIVNGVPAQAVRTSNPRFDLLEDEDCDLVMSLLSAGFHYPLSNAAGDYVAFAERVLRPGGALIYDLRNGEPAPAFARPARTTLVGEGSKHKRFMLTLG